MSGEHEFAIDPGCGGCLLAPVLWIGCCVLLPLAWLYVGIGSIVERLRK